MHSLAAILIIDWLFQLFFRQKFKKMWDVAAFSWYRPNNFHFKMTHVSCLYLHCQMANKCNPPNLKLQALNFKLNINRPSVFEYVCLLTIFYEFHRRYDFFFMRADEEAKNHTNPPLVWSFYHVTPMQIHSPCPLQKHSSYSYLKCDVKQRTHKWFRKYTSVGNSWGDVVTGFEK